MDFLCLYRATQVIGMFQGVCTEYLLVVNVAYVNNNLVLLQAIEKFNLPYNMFFCEAQFLLSINFSAQQ